MPLNLSNKCIAKILGEPERAPNTLRNWKWCILLYINLYILWDVILHSNGLMHMTHASAKLEGIKIVGICVVHECTGMHEHDGACGCNLLTHTDQQS